MIGTSGNVEDLRREKRVENEKDDTDARIRFTSLGSASKEKIADATGVSDSPGSKESLT